MKRNDATLSGKNLCVFCGAKSAINADFQKLYDDLGQSLASLLAKNEMGMVYGGASIGLMGTMADYALKAKVPVYGVIPQSLVDYEVAHQGLTELKVVTDMHQRKKWMYDWSDYFVALPGGMGTLDELCEILTWAQLKYHQKPIFLVNSYGFYDHLIKHFDSICQNGFLSKEHRDLVIVVNGLEDLFQRISR